MIDIDDRYCPDDSKVATQVVDGEAIVINLANGLYFSIGGSGGFIWSLIERQETPRRIADRVSAHFDLDGGRALSDVQTLIAQLVDEELIIPVAPDALRVEAAPPIKPTNELYAPPLLKRFDDMADMFALDPPLPGLARER